MSRSNSGFLQKSCSSGIILLHDALLELDTLNFLGVLGKYIFY